jgi:AmiR/NasT family two-component response regulator
MLIVSGLRASPSDRGDAARSLRALRGRTGAAGSCTGVTVKSPIKPPIFILGNERSGARPIAELLRQRGHEVSVYLEASDLMLAVGARAPALVILCVAGGGDWECSLGVTLVTMFAVPFIVLADSWDESGVRTAAESGALCFLVGAPTRLQECVPAIIAAMAHHAELREYQERVRKLTQALHDARTISTACGVLMERFRLNRREAFERLRAAARARRMRLLDSAAEALAALESINALGARDRDAAHSSVTKTR